MTTNTEEARTERDLRVAHPVGCLVRLQDGDLWTVPARPAVGPIANAIVDTLDQLAGIVGDQLQLQVDLSKLMSQAEALAEVPEDLDDEARKALEAERKEQLQALRGEGDKLTGRARELERRAMQLGFEAIGEAMRVNYPALTDHDLERLVSAAHIGPLLAIVRGERQLDDLFPSGGNGADPRTA